MLLCTILSLRQFRHRLWHMDIWIEALLTPIIGGVGTVFGPLLGALVVRLLGEGQLTGDVPGLDFDLVWRRACPGHLVYAARPHRWLRADPRMVDAARCAGRCFHQRGGPWLIQWLEIQWLIEWLIRFSSSIASRAVSADCWAWNAASHGPTGHITALMPPTVPARRRCSLFISGLLKPSDGNVRYAGRSHYRRSAVVARHRADIQIVQPFGGLPPCEKIFWCRRTSAPSWRRGGARCRR